jgi:hypothetical protein
MSLSPKEEQELALLLEWDVWSANPSQFIADCCLTRDEADGGKTKPFPDKDYLRLIDERFATEPILAIPKSRRMIVTWRMLALHLHHGLFIPNQAIFIQSKTLGDSAYLLGEERIMFMYGKILERFPYHPWPRLTRKASFDRGYEMLQFSNGTSIYAVAQGPDKLRQYTASRVYCTEMAFWESAEDTWTALLPTIQGGGKIVIESSAEPGFFAELIGATK